MFSFLKPLVCAIRGHKETEPLTVNLPHRSHIYGGSLWPIVEYYCSRCQSRFYTRYLSKPPEDEPHRYEIFEFHMVSQKNPMWRAACWCGWRDNNWHDTQEFAEASGEVHIRE